MAQHSAKHAMQIVAQFQTMIGSDVSSGIASEHFAELALLIESAIDTAVLMRMERVASEVGAVADRIRHDAEHYAPIT